MTEENKSVKNFPNGGFSEIPKLRFTEFTRAWENKKLGEIAVFSKGKGISKIEIVENGETECIRYGELYTFYEELISEIKSKTNTDISSLVLSEANDVIIPASGETQIDIATASCVLKSGVALGGDLNIIKTKNNGVFLSYYLNSKKKLEIAKLSQGISVVHLYSSQLALLNLNLPELEEQDKLANFLSILNSRISTQRKIISQSLSQMSNLKDLLFEQKLRFKDENSKVFSDWKEFKLSDLGNTFNGLSGKTKEHFGFGQKYIQYKQIFDSDKIKIANCAFVNVEENENQNAVQYGDAFFTISSETPDEIGMSSVLLENVDSVYLNSFCFGFRTHSFNELIPEFSQFLFRSNIFRNEIIKLAQGSTRYNMSKVEFLKLTVQLPNKEEQTKIANFLSSIQEKIETEKQILEKLKLQKKFLFANLFV